MKIQKKFLLGISSLLMAASVANAQAPSATPVVEDAVADDEAVLFKVHDISPVKDKVKDMITSCDFYVTFYNRSQKDINGAELDLTWLDDSLVDVISDEKQDSAEKNKNGENIDPEFSYTQRGNPIDLTASINMPAIKSYKQITVRSTLKTDRCFVLLKELSLNVKSCSTKNEGTQLLGAQANSCSGLFHFVSQNNPEYYMEFKPVSYNEEKVTERKLRANQEKEMEEQYKKTIQGFDSLTQTLSEIK